MARFCLKFAALFRLPPLGPFGNLLLPSSSSSSSFSPMVIYFTGNLFIPLLLPLLLLVRIRVGGAAQPKLAARHAHLQLKFSSEQ